MTYAVGFHEWPGGFEVDQSFACGRILAVDSHPVTAHITVAVWDEADFLDRVGADAAVRYADPDGSASCAAIGCTDDVGTADG
jgi:hypothetical protein